MRSLPAVVLLLAISSAPGASSEPEGDPATAAFTKGPTAGATWSGAYTVRGGGGGLRDWTLAFDVPPAVTVDLVANGWAERTGDRVTIRPQGWAATIPPGGSVEIGLKGSAPGPWDAPTRCRLDARPCDGGILPPDGGAPPSPTGLRAAWVGSSRALLAWGAPADRDDLRYEILRDGALAGETRAFEFAVRGLLPSTVYRFAVRAVDETHRASPASETLAVTTTERSDLRSTARLAPYVDVTLHPPPDLARAHAETGIAHFSLAFVVAHGGECRGSWGGVHPVESGFLREEIERLRDRGGDVLLSFGGAAGRELATVCRDAETLAAAYRTAIEAYDASFVDLDVEGASLHDAAANDRRARALAALQSEAEAGGRILAVSFTLPVMPWGLTPAGVDLVANALANGVRVDRVNVMAMDYGEPPPARPPAPHRADPAALQTGQGPDMGANAVAAAESTRSQLAEIGLPSYATLGVTPMLGQNDVAHEVFLVEDATRLGAFARDRGVGFLSFWSLARDRPCPAPQPGVASPTCSGTSAPPGAFAAAFRAALG